MRGDNADQPRACTAESRYTGTEKGRDAPLHTHHVTCKEVIRVMKKSKKGKGGKGKGGGC
jgi:hypothetical protein